MVDWIEGNGFDLDEDIVGAWGGCWAMLDDEWATLGEEDGGEVLVGGGRHLDLEIIDDF